MARFNEILVGRYNRFMQKLLSMKGQASLVTLSDEMMPVFPFVNGAENRYLEAWDKFGLISNLNGVAGNQSAARMRNPPTSNIVAVFEKIYIISNATTQIALHAGATTTDLTITGGASTSRFDARGRPSPSLIQSFQASAPSAPTPPNQFLTTSQNNATTPIDVIITDFQEIPLLPGDAIQVTTVNANVTLTVSFWWRERFLEDSERT